MASDGDDSAVPSAPAQQQRPQFLALVGVAMLALGAGSFLIGRSLDRQYAELVGRNTPIDAAATDPRVIDANNSPTVVRNQADGRNLVVVNRIDTPRFSCAIHVSFDGGATWQRSTIPFPEGEELPARCFAPDAAFGPDGSLHVSFATLEGRGNTPHAAWVASSTDGGRSFSKPTFALGPLSFQVRLATDPERPERLWLSWLAAAETVTLGFAQPGNPVKVARSDDAGATWGEPVVVNPPTRARVIAPSIAVGDSGEPYVLYLDLGDDRLDYHAAHQGRGGEPYPGTWSLVLARSADGGRTWTESVVERRLVPTERVIVLFPPSPSLAVDARGRAVYVGYADGRLGDADVWVWASKDRGTTFSPARRVNDTPSTDGTSQYLPRLAVAPGGRVDVVYYDRRADPKNVMNEVSLQSSEDGGRTWQRSVRLSDQPFDSRIGFGSERGLPDLGSRLGLVSTAERALAVWSDTRAGTEASNKQDLARAVVVFDDPSPLSTPLRAGGLALGALGLVAVVPSLGGAVRRLRRAAVVP